MSAALALPGIAQAHGGGNYTAAAASSAPTVDGVVNTAEWSDATPYSVVFGSLGNATVRFVHTATDLYVGVVVVDSSPGVGPNFSVYFDDDHDGVKELGEDAWLAFPTFGQDYFWDPDGAGGGVSPSHYNDSVDGGTADTTAAGTIAGNDVMFELRHPLCTSDDTHDICTSVGQTHGVNFKYERGSPSGSFAWAPGADSLNPGDWADVALAAAGPDTTPPTVRVTAPAAGSIVSGTVTAAADASDNVGVTQVDFRYFDGALPYHELGSDTEAPYTATFNSTLFEDRAAGAGTLYAVAHDAAGNTTTVGNGIGIDNSSPMGEVDLSVDSIAFTAPASFPPYSYTVTVRNAGTVAANVSDVVVQGYYSADTVIQATDSPACGVLMTGTLAAASTTQVAVGCSAPPGGHSYLLVRVDDDNALAESDETNNVGVAALTPATVTGASISITGDSSAIAGAASALISDIPIEAITGAGDDGPSATPLAGIPLAGIPLAGIPLAGIPLAGIPLAGIGFTEDNLDQNGLGGVPLSSIPLDSTTDSWQARLNANPAFAGSPVQSVTLGEVLGTSVVTTPTPVSLEDLNLAASPLAGIPLAGIALGGLPLAGIPLAGIGASTAANLAAWCDFIDDQPGFDCTDPNSLSSETVLGISLQGVPLAGIPLAGIPLAGIDLAGSPLAGIPLAGIDLAGSPLAGIPLAGINFASSPLAGIPLAGISATAQAELLDCPTGGFTCAPSDTLGGAFTAGAIADGATVGDIGYYCEAGSPTESPCLAGDTPISLRDFVLNGLPSDVTLEDLLGTILSETAYDWESLPLPGFPIQDFSDDGGVIDYTAAFTLAGPREGGSFTATIRAKIPEGARYVAGSTQVPEGLTASEPTLLAADNELEWQVSGIPANSPQTLAFDVKSPLNLAPVTATAELEIGSILEQAKTPVNTNIRQTWEFFEGTPEVKKDTLYFGYTANGDDRDFFRLDVPAAGTQVTVRLSHLGLDADLVVYGDVPPPLRTPKPSTSALQAGDVRADLQQRAQAITPEVLGDVPLSPPEGMGVLGISDNRGLADEEVTFIVPEDSDGSIRIQISSFDGAYSNEPWMLRVEESAPIELPAGCKLPLALGGGETKSLPALSPTGSTLYLFNSKRYGDLYGHAAETSTWTKLLAMAARSDAAGGTVIPIDAIPSVTPALAAWEAEPCSPGRTNDAVRALGKYLDTIPASYKYIVLVGDWTVIPPGLILDNTLYANERDYASTFYGAENTQYLSSYALGYLPTDDPYGDTSYSGSGPYVPEVAVGRLVEKPAEIEAQLDQYLSPAVNGAINPTTGLVTGYDFLSDGANAISTGLEANVTPSELINDVWSKDDLLAAMFPATNPPAIASINAHYDHYRALAANENTAGTESDLFMTEHLEATPGRLVITIGCHSGTPVPDSLFAGPFAADWDQSYAAQGAIGYVAQSTFGLGETAGVAYSEKLHALLAERLNGSLTVGQALVFAKQEYSAMPLQGGYDVKVINGSGLYGLPMYRVGTGTLAPPPAPLTLETDAATGLKAASFNLSPSFTRVNASTGSYFTNGGNASFQNRRPIEPFTKLDVTQPDHIAHGALLTAAVSNDQLNFNAAFSRAVEDSAALSPELVGDATSPTRLQTIATFSTPVGPQQRLVVSTGQFLADGVPDAQGIGTQRLFSSLGGVVLYAPPTATDFSPPTFGPVSAFASSPSTIGFAVDVEDEEGNGEVKRVLALYKDGSGAWRAIDLAHPAGSTRWSGGGPFTGTNAEWFLQAVDAFGNVGVISNKAHIDPVILPPATGGITATVDGPQTNDWYTGDATVTVSGATGILTSVDGGSFQPNSIVTVSGTGLHTVEYQGSGGSHGTTIVPIDVSDPTIAVKQGIAQTEVGQALTTSGLFTCADAGSGVASCTVSGIDTSTATLNGATRTFTVTATDRVGRSSTATGTYRVIWSFQGFFQPVDNLPVLNSVKAGSAVPTKFSLGGNQGLDIFAGGYPRSGNVACDAADPVTELDATVTAGSSSLSYDAGTGRYNYVWKTDKAWAGTCRQLVMLLADGTTHRANFKFK